MYIHILEEYYFKAIYFYICESHDKRLLLWNAQRVLLGAFIERGTTITAGEYYEMLTKLRRFY